MFIAVAALAIAALAAFIAYNFMYVSICFPDNDLFIGKTINASGLYHPEQFSWYTYDQIDYWTSHTDPPVVRMTTIYDNRSYDGAPALHVRDIFTGYGTPTNFFQINDMYYDENGRWLAGRIQASDNGSLMNPGSINCSGSVYHKYVFLLEDDKQIAPRGTETITVRNKTYVCDRYYQPDQQDTLWFAASIPVPVKVQPADGHVAFELAGWG
jgi:hypothetical protein